MIEIYMMAWNRLLECWKMLMPEWERKMQGNDLLAKFRAMDFMEVTKDARTIKELDIDLMLRTVNHLRVHKNRTVVTLFLDGTEISMKV